MFLLCHPWFGEMLSFFLFLASTVASPREKINDANHQVFTKPKVFLPTASHTPLAYPGLAYPYTWLLVSVLSLPPAPPPFSSFSSLTPTSFIIVHGPTSGIFPVTRDRSGLTRLQRAPTWWSSWMGLAFISYTDCIASLVPSICLYSSRHGVTEVQMWIHLDPNTAF